MKFNDLSNYVIEGNAKGAEAWTKEALSKGIEAQTIVNQGLMPGMAVVGEKFKTFEYFMPDVLVSVRAMKASMALLKPLLAASEGSTLGKVVIGTVKGDLHDIGKNLVGMMLEGAGFMVVDLGTDVSADAFLKAVEKEKPEVIGLSALLSTTMPAIKNTIEHLKQNGARDSVKVIIGGAPVTAAFASSVGADGYAPDAPSAVDKVKELLNIA